MDDIAAAIDGNADLVKNAGRKCRAEQLEPQCEATVDDAWGRDHRREQYQWQKQDANLPPACESEDQSRK